MDPLIEEVFPIENWYIPSIAMLVYQRVYMCQGLNSHYFHRIGDKLINPIVEVKIYPLQGFLLKVG